MGPLIYYSLFNTWRTTASRVVRISCRKMVFIFLHELDNAICLLILCFQNVKNYLTLCFTYVDLFCMYCTCNTLSCFSVSFFLLAVWRAVRFSCVHLHRYNSVIGRNTFRSMAFVGSHYIQVLYNCIVTTYISTSSCVASLCHLLSELHQFHLATHPTILRVRPDKKVGNFS